MKTIITMVIVECQIKKRRGYEIRRSLLQRWTKISFFSLHPVLLWTPHSFLCILFNLTPLLSPHASALHTFYCLILSIFTSSPLFDFFSHFPLLQVVYSFFALLALISPLLYFWLSSPSFLHLFISLLFLHLFHFFASFSCVTIKTQLISKLLMFIHSGEQVVRRKEKKRETEKSIQKKKKQKKKGWREGMRRR